jgi:hypothetical protein
MNYSAANWIDAHERNPDKPDVYSVIVMLENDREVVSVQAVATWDGFLWSTSETETVMFWRQKE